MIINTYKKIISVWNQFHKQKGRVHLEGSPNIKASIKNSKYMMRTAKQYEGKLLLRNEISMPDSVFQKLLTYNLFTAIPSISETFYRTNCIRCNNEKPSLFATIPCARCNQIHLYCRKCIQMGRVMTCEKLYYWSGINYVWNKHENPCTWTGTLSHVQHSAAHKITEAVTNKEELLVWAVTGAGKTEMLFPGITTALQEGKRICIATPRADVVRELLPRLQKAFAMVHIQGLFGGSRDNDGTAQLIVATTHQLLRYQHAFDVLIIDEIDAFPFHHDESLQFAAKRAMKQEASFIYLTATPRKKLRKRISTKKIDYVFVPSRFHGHPLQIPKLLYCSSLKTHLAAGSLPHNVERWLDNRKKPSRQLLIFVPTIQLANKLNATVCTLFLEKGLIATSKKVSSVHAEDKNREEKIHLFRRREIYVLITTTILERGVTFPAIDVAVLNAGHDVFDEAALVQIAGRAGRSPTDPTGEVVFFHEGKTDAILLAREEIQKMNKRSEKLRIRSK